MSPSRFTWALCAALAAACAVAAPSRAADSCGWSGYSYAGMSATAPAHGIAARLTAVSAPSVENGHVAAWVGVGGSGAGPGGSDEWLQVGLSAFPGSGSKLYYEAAVPGQKPRYVMLNAQIPLGAGHRVAVLELAHRPSWWRVWVDGSSMTRPIHLPGSHGSLAPTATAESWDGGVPSCNGFGYRFDRVQLARHAGGGWTPFSGRSLQDPGYRVRRRSLSSFVADRG